MDSTEVNWVVKGPSFKGVLPVEPDEYYIAVSALRLPKRRTTTPVVYICIREMIQATTHIPAGYTVPSLKTVFLHNDEILVKHFFGQDREYHRINLRYVDTLYLYMLDADGKLIELAEPAMVELTFKKLCTK
jgi:hypothetical protein